VRCRRTVVNAGLSGNRLLSQALGDGALARFDRDVSSVRARRTSFSSRASTTSAPSSGNLFDEAHPLATTAADIEAG